MTEDTKRKIAAARTGKTHSPETRTKIAEAMRGRRKSVEHLSKIQASNMEHVKTPEHLRALAEARQRNMERRRAGFALLRPPLQLRTRGKRYEPITLPSLTLTAEQWGTIDSFLRAPADAGEDFTLSQMDDGRWRLWGFRVIRGADTNAPGNMEGIAALGNVRCPARQRAVTFITPDGPREVLLMLALDPDSEAMTDHWRKHNG